MLEVYRLKNKEFMGLKLSKENAVEVFDWIYETHLCELTITPRVSLKIRVEYNTLYALEGDYVLKDIFGNVLVRNEKEFNSNFIKK